MSYFNSTIKPTIGFCSDCPEDSIAKPLTAGRCQYHYKLNRASVAEEKKETRRNRIPIRTFHKPQPVFEATPIAGLNEWFNRQYEKLTGRCANCGEPTKVFDAKAARFTVAHILGKKQAQFPSVAMLDLNWLELCSIQANNCHAQYDSSWLNASKMKIWPRVIILFPLIYPHIAESERGRIPELLLPYIPKELNQ